MQKATTLNLTRNFAETKTMSVPPSCRRCRHYYITHVPRQPHGCKAYAFKSRSNPAQFVLNSSGRPCLLFAPKK